MHQKKKISCNIMKAMSQTLCELFRTKVNPGFVLHQRICSHWLL